jgi:hypothetical protein
VQSRLGGAARNAALIVEQLALRNGAVARSTQGG